MKRVGRLNGEDNSSNMPGLAWVFRILPFDFNVLKCFNVDFKTCQVLEISSAYRISAGLNGR